MMELRQDGPIFTIELTGEENRLTLAFLQQLDATLDDALARAGDGPGALVMGATGKFWSTGIDLERLQVAPPEEQGAFLPALHEILGRLVSFPMPTAAALNGHAFAGGALLAFALDHRVMREDRGWFCLPEVDIHVQFTPEMMALLKAKLRPDVLRDAVLSGHRYTGPEAVAAGLVDEACSLETLRERTAARLAPLAAKSRGTFAKFKWDLYGDLARDFGHEP